MSDEPYSVFAKIYDRVMAGTDYPGWIRYVEQILQRFGVTAHRILDLACGTGNTTLPWAEKGLEVLGIDRSPHMLERARTKAASRGLRVRFLEADMTTFQVPAPVDLVTCLYDSLNYLLQPEQVRSTFARVRDALRPGGLFVFDVNTPEMIRRVQEGRIVVEDSPDVVLFWEDSVDVEGCLWEVLLTGFLKEGDVYVRFCEVHRERGYSVHQLRGYLQAVGLRPLAAYEAFTFRAASIHTPRVCMVARRPVVSCTGEEELRSTGG